MNTQADQPGLVIAGTGGPVADSLASMAIEQGWRVARFELDLARSGEVEAAFAELTESWKGAPSALVHFGFEPHGIASVTESASGWQAVQEGQLDAAFLFVQAGVREMLRLRGGSAVDDGSVVFVGDAFSSRAIPGMPMAGAGAASAGLGGLVRQLAVEWGPYGVRVNMVRAGAVEGDAPRPGHLVRRVPLGRAATPEEIAAACYYLISRSSSYVTGVALAADGGFLAT